MLLLVQGNFRLLYLPVGLDMEMDQESPFFLELEVDDEISFKHTTFVKGYPSLTCGDENTPPHTPRIFSSECLLPTEVKSCQDFSKSPSILLEFTSPMKSVALTSTTHKNESCIRGLTLSDADNIITEVIDASSDVGFKAIVEDAAVEINADLSKEVTDCGDFVNSIDNEIPPIIIAVEKDQPSLEIKIPVAVGPAPVVDEIDTLSKLPETTLNLTSIEEISSRSCQGIQGAPETIESTLISPSQNSNLLLTGATSTVPQFLDPVKEIIPRSSRIPSHLLSSYNTELHMPKYSQAEFDAVIEAAQLTANERFHASRLGAITEDIESKKGLETRILQLQDENNALMEKATKLEKDLQLNKDESNLNKAQTKALTHRLQVIHVKIICIHSLKCHRRAVTYGTIVLTQILQPLRNNSFALNKTFTQSTTEILHHHHYHIRCQSGSRGRII